MIHSVAYRSKENQTRAHQKRPYKLAMPTIRFGPKQLTDKEKPNYNGNPARLNQHEYD